VECLISQVFRFSIFSYSLAVSSSRQGTGVVGVLVETVLLLFIIICVNKVITT
jgi:hypothetical protein